MNHLCLPVNTTRRAHPQSVNFGNSHSMQALSSALIKEYEELSDRPQCIWHHALKPRLHWKQLSHYCMPSLWGKVVYRHTGTCKNICTMSCYTIGQHLCFSVNSGSLCRRDETWSKKNKMLSTTNWYRFIFSVKRNLGSKSKLNLIHWTWQPVIIMHFCFMEKGNSDILVQTKKRNKSMKQNNMGRWWQLQMICRFKVQLDTPVQSVF